MYLEWRDVNGKVERAQMTPDMEPVTIGRKPNVSRVFSNETTVSRDHGRIGFDDQERAYYIKDIGSANGTFVNGKQVKRATIVEGDVVRCGERFEIACRAGDAPAAGAAKPREATGERPRMAQPTLNQAGALNELHDQLRRQGHMPDLQRLDARTESPRAAEPRPEPARADAPRAEPVRADLRSSERPVVAAAPAREPYRPATGPSPAVSNAQLAELDDLRRRTVEIQNENVRLTDRATKAENRIREMERNSVADEGLYDKYAQLKEHAQTLTRQLERTREELAHEQNRALEADAKVRDLDRRLKEAEDKSGDAQERIAGLKVRVTQKDRQIEELQRQYDQLDYEARALKDQVLSLESIINDGNFSNNSYERKINMLQEIIQEKENLIQEKKAELRAKEVELRQAQMGVGLSDLEHEKRKLLEDFHNSIKRNDEQAERLSQQSRQMEQLKSEVEAAKAAADKKPKEIDVAEHPDYKAKQRELERVKEDLTQVQRDLAKAEGKLEHVMAEGKSAKGLEVDLERYKARADELEKQLRDAELRVTELIEQPAQKGVAMTEDTRSLLDDLLDSASSNKHSATMARTTAERLNRQRDKTGGLADDVELVFDSLVVLAGDLGMLEGMLKTLRRDLGVD